MVVILVKVAIGLCCSLLAYLAIRSEALAKLPFRQFVFGATGATLLSRLLLFAMLYLVLGYSVPSDVPGAYYPEAKSALSGKLVYRDFWTTYSPFHPYIDAAAVALWDSTKSIVLLAILFEALAIPLWLRLGMLEFPEQVVRGAAILYVFSPLLLSTVAIAGQNHVWISPFLAAALYAKRKQRGLLAGILLGLSLLTVKFLVLIFVPVVFLYRKQYVTFLLGFAGIVGVIGAAFYANGANLLAPLYFQRAGGQESSGSLPYLMTLVGVPMTSPVYILMALVLAGGLCLFLWLYRDRLSGAALISAAPVCLFALVLLFSKKAFTTYWACCFMMLAWLISERLKTRPWILPAFLLWGTVAMVEPTLYFRWVLPRIIPEMIQSIPAYQSVLFLLAQGVLLAFSMLTAWLGFTKCLQSTLTPVAAAASAEGGAAVPSSVS